MKKMKRFYVHGGKAYTPQDVRSLPHVQVLGKSVKARDAKDAVRVALGKSKN